MAGNKNSGKVSNDPKKKDFFVRLPEDLREVLEVIKNDQRLGSINRTIVWGLTQWLKKIQK